MMDRKALDRYRLVIDLLDGMNCGVVIRDTGRVVTAANRRLLQWLGYERSEVEGHPLLNLVPEENRDVNLDAMKETEEGDTRARLTAIQRKDGTTLPVLILSTPFLNETDDPAGTLSIVIDMGTVQTAKHVGHPEDLQATLGRIAIELHSICASGGFAGPAVPLDHPALAELSGRESEVLKHIMEGGRVPAIAQELHISPHTVRNHLKSIFRKLGVSSQAELIQHVRALAKSPAVQPEPAEE
jgi:PAS domain S-box-containing protein